MIIDTSNFKAIPALLAASLNESAESASTLELELAEWGHAEFKEETPITLMHQGAPLFHGKVTSVACSNNRQAKRTLVTATNAVWVLEHQPCASQIAEIKEAAKNSEIPANFAQSYADIRQVMRATVSSWEKMALACKIAAPYWACDAAGNPLAEVTLALDTSRAVYSAQPTIEKHKAYTAWQALNIMRETNPDALFLVRPLGSIEVVSIKNAPVLNWDVELIQEISDLSPRYEDAIAGVVVCVSYTGEYSSATKTLCYPTDLDLNSSQIRIFTASVDQYSRLQAQANHLLNQARAFFLAANELQWSGSILLQMEKVNASPLGCRLNISGEGAHPDWATMNAVVCSCTWDFFAGTLSLELGMQIDDPALHELTWQDAGDGGGDGGDSSDNGGQSSIPYYSRSSESSDSQSQSINSPPPPSLDDDTLIRIMHEFDAVWRAIGWDHTWLMEHGIFNGIKDEQFILMNHIFGPHLYNASLTGNCPNHMCGHLSSSNDPPTEADLKAHANMEGECPYKRNG